MTDKTDEFDQDQFESMDSQDSYGAQTAKPSLWETVKNKPIVKLLVIMGFVGVALAGALGSFSGKKEQGAALISKPPGLNEVPGGAVTPFFKEQNDKANAQRVGQALTEGGSALPTPVGHDVADLTDKRKDPLVEFRAETERLRQELALQQKQNAQQLQAMQQQMLQGQRVAGEDDSLAKAMQKQMQELMAGWAPKPAKFVTGTAPEDKEPAVLQPTASAQSLSLETSSQTAQKKPILMAGTVNYAQLLTEANSDVPGPILAQILSGPLSGGRAIGRFQVMNDYLVLTFNLVTYKGKDYAINAMALDPDTTLGGMATEVDHRYFTRILLPAAASFAQAFGQTLSETETETTVSDGTVVSDQAKKGMKEALYSGLGEVGDTLSEFFRNEANNTKTLVRVAVGTPMGLFFLQSVQDNPQQGMGQTDDAALASLLKGYQQMGYGGAAGPTTSYPSYDTSGVPYNAMGVGGASSADYNRALQSAVSSGQLTPAQVQMIKNLSR